MEGSTLTHLDREGRAQMVDVSQKNSTSRVAVASCMVKMGKKAMEALVEKSVPKGDVYSTARIAGILAAKRVDELIPLCHPLPLNFVQVEFELLPDVQTVKITAEARTDAKTGVEMEAMTAVSIAALTVYDMLKGIEKGITITDIQLEYKSGGKSGVWKRGDCSPTL